MKSPVEKALKAKMGKKDFGGGHRSYPLKNEVGELRKHRGEKGAEQGLHSYKKMREFSKASGTWGKKNTKDY